MEEVMEMKDLIGWSVGIMLSLSVVIEISPIKLNPWTHIAKWIGKAINGEVMEKVDALNKDLQDLKHTTDERNAKLLRSHILTFGDEILHDQKHSKERFDQILQDITEYERYCHEHPEFKYNMTRLSTKRIQTVYEQCMIDGSFS